MKNLMFVLLLTAQALGSFAHIDDSDNNKLSAETTTMIVDHETFNWGVVTEGEKVKVVFTVTNSGTNNLFIANAKGSCGCTVPEWPREAIAPGKSARITAVFDSKGKAGNQSKKVTITANTDPVETYLTLKGLVNENNNKNENAEPREQPVISDDLFNISPNPANDHIDVTFNGTKQMQLLIFDNTGKKVFETKIDADTRVDLSKYRAGIYTAMVKNDDSTNLAKHFILVD
jgi:hypothetical protein